MIVITIMMISFQSLLYLCSAKLAAAGDQATSALIVEQGLPGAHLRVNTLPAE